MSWNCRFALDKMGFYEVSLISFSLLFPSHRGYLLSESGLVAAPIPRECEIAVLGKNADKKINVR